MELFTEKQKETLLHVFTWFGITVGSMLVITLLVGGVAYAYETSYRDTFFRGVRIADISLDGLTRTEARMKLEQRLSTVYSEGYTFVFEGKTAPLPATQLSLEDPDLAQDLILYDIEKTLDAAFAVGRTGDLFSQHIERLRLLIRPKHVPVDHIIQKTLVKRALDDAFEDQVKIAKDAVIQVQTTSTEAGVDIHITEEEVGVAFNEAAALKTLSKQAGNLVFSPIHLDTIRVEPRVHKADIEPLKGQAPDILENAPFRIRYLRSSWVISEDTLATWLGAVPDEHDELRLGIVPEKLTDTLTELGNNLIREPKDGRLVLGDGLTVEEFVEPVAGQTIDAEKTIENIHELWAAESGIEADLALKTLEPSIEGDDAERLGIREVLGIGRSDFAGSPPNRRYNINLGASKMNGLIIPPGEEFSQLRSLGSVTAANGWLPELVIKGNETVPEYGGGLCQIGTTSFRAALASGLEITERRNHSYRVSYYEPAGTDATIYEPAPDFRFRNDTSHHILITSRTEGNEVVTTVWGTDDGRVAEQTKPVIYNITSPPPTKIIETTDLPPGTRRCTESAHAGASAQFDYTVTYADGSKHEETFHSYYRPWQAVCLVGVESLSEDGNEGSDGGSDSGTGSENSENDGDASAAE